MGEEWNHKIFSVREAGFESLAIEIFKFQFDNNPVYRAYTKALHINPATITGLEQIPFLPIRFFKSHPVLTTLFEPELVFESSGTTPGNRSRHFLKDLSLYEESFKKGFQNFYGPEKDWCIIGLLPSYLDRKNSSLAFMVDKLIQSSEHHQSGFYLDEYEKLFSELKGLENRKQKTLLIGVTFALLDFAEKYSMPLRYTTIMETGGMKGRKKEMIRQEVHEVLKMKFGVRTIHAEYGMTELLSQAYSKEEGIYYCPSWMKVMLRDEEDPLWVKKSGTGAVNIIDLANLYSCSFIATDDAGKVNDNGSFEILGRMDGSDLRGCSLLVV